MTWEIVFTRQAQKDAQKLAEAGLKPKAEKLIRVLRENPYQTPPPYEKLVGDLAGANSRRINIRHRLVYQVLDPSNALDASGKVIRVTKSQVAFRRRRAFAWAWMPGTYLRAGVHPLVLTNRSGTRTHRRAKAIVEPAPRRTLTSICLPNNIDDEVRSWLQKASADAA